MTGIEKAILAAGGQEELGKLLKPPVTQQAVSAMRQKGYVGPDRAAEIRALFPDIQIEELIDPAIVRMMEASA